ncbi:hypothetical protein CAEBREN_04001 [Caenorhabditis brenneri]|uniref:F-box associated domain-containing protein n=1 Tax=Caenorhabditis brenneri TaxID=135651 RepID=G0MWF6_CAEBE|nr:hypothetical protein CAEBREN_04001 [Caenorhabditis brenneri]
MVFPITQLPYLPLKQVLRGIDVAIQIDLSFAAENVRDALSSLQKPSIETVVRFSPGIMDIVMAIPENDYSVVEVQLKMDRVIRNRTHIMLHGNKIYMTRTRNVLKFQRDKTIEKNYEYLNLLLAHLDKTFKLSGLSVILEYIDISGFLFKNWNSFEYVKIYNQDLSPELGWFFFKNIQTKELAFRTTSVQTPNGPHNFPLTHQVIQLDSCNWITFDSILNMECQRFSVGKGDKGNMQVTDIVNFVHSWSNGGLNNLVNCEIDLPRLWIAQDLNYEYAKAIFNKLVSMGVQTSSSRAGDLKKEVVRSDKKVALLTINTIFKFKLLPPTSTNDSRAPAP